MRRSGRLFVLCLLLLLLPLRGVLAAAHLGCEPPPATHAPHAHPTGANGAHGAHGSHGAHGDHGQAHATAAKACKLCAPCCLAAAPPPALTTNAATCTPATRAGLAPAEAWVSVVPPLPDPPPRA